MHPSGRACAVALESGDTPRQEELRLMLVLPLDGTVPAMVLLKFGGRFDRR